jgi:hypothetical protein
MMPTDSDSDVSSDAFINRWPFDFEFVGQDGGAKDTMRLVAACGGEPIVAKPRGKGGRILRSAILEARRHLPDIVSRAPECQPTLATDLIQLQSLGKPGPKT